MKTPEIKKLIQSIENEYNIEVLFAIESGSRAWGFASDDSDYDVRFVYKQPLNHYLSLQMESQVIDLPEKDLIDVHGWDLRKALSLLYKSNPSLIEWLHSPIVYKQTASFDALKALANDYCDSKTLIMHYLSMANAALKHTSTTETKVSIKKYLYYLRAILAAQYVRVHRTPAPVLFESLWSVVDDEAILAHIKMLFDQKQTSRESDIIDRIVPLEAYCNRMIQSIQTELESIHKSERDQAPLNAFFMEQVCV